MGFLGFLGLWPLEICKVTAGLKQMRMKVVIQGRESCMWMIPLSYLCLEMPNLN